MSERAEPVPNIPAGEDDVERQLIKADIEQAREQLADTVDQLAGKLDVRAQAGRRAAEVRQSVGQHVAQAKQAAPAPVQHAMETAVAKAGPPLRDLGAHARPRRNTVAMSAGAVLLVAVVVRRVRTSARTGRTARATPA